MSSSLRPEARVNKLGHVVVKHVKDGVAVSNTAASRIPAPSFAKTQTKPLSREEMIDSVLQDMKRVKYSPRPDNVKTFLRGFSDDKHMEFISNLTKRMSAEDMRSLFSGAIDRPTHMMDIDHHLFLTAAYAFDRCKEISDADPSGRNWGEWKSGHEHWLFSFAKEALAPSMKFRFNEDVVSDLESAYLLHRLKLTEKSFNSTGGYYRALGKISEMRDEITPYLPLLLAMDTAFEGKPNNYFFDDEYYFWENLSDIMKFPKDKIEYIARETHARGDYDPELAQAIVDNASGHLSEGVL